MKKFKMPTAYTILITIMIVIAGLTWIIPAGAWDETFSTYTQIESNGQGLWQILGAPVAGFYDAIDIALFVIVIGGFLGIVIKTGAMDAGIGKLLKVFKGQEFLLIPILMVLFGIGGSTYGMAEETIAFYPLIIPIFLAAGYDVVTAVMVILLGAGVGVLGSTVNPFAIGAASSVVDISMGVGLFSRLLLFALVEGAAILFTLNYAKKVKANKQNSIVADLWDEHLEHFTKTEEAPELTGRRKAVLVIFGLTFVVMILGVIPWAWKFDVLFFDNINNWIADQSWLAWLGIKNSGSDAYGESGVSASALGDWWFGQMTILFLVSSIIIGKVAKMKEHEIVSTFVQGSRDLLGVALIIGVSRGIKVVMAAGGMDATILYWGSQALKDLSGTLFIIFTYIFYLPMSFLIPSTSGLATATMPIMGPLGELVYNTSDGTGASLVITAYSAASGVINLITPTSGVVMGALTLSRLPYDRWLKFTFKFLLILSVIIIVLLSALSLFI